MKSEILWDTWGVPHIFAEDEVGLAYASGQAQMRSHGNLILRLYAQARGCAAEYLGEAFLESDRKAITQGIPELTEHWYSQQSERIRAVMEAFAEGINDFAEKHVDTLNPALLAVLPVTGKDIQAHTLRAMYFHFVYRDLIAADMIQRWQNAPASNAWVIAPKKSASGNAMILGNPHLPWSDLFLFYEMQVTASDYNFYGASLVGFPFPSLGFNDYLAWTHTVNTYQGYTLYELQLEGEGYRFDGAVRDFETSEHIIKVRQADGSLQEIPHTVRRSVHGSIIAEKDGKVIALRVAGLDRYASMEIWLDMTQTKNLQEFEACLKRMQLPMFNTLYADREGNILEFYTGHVPIRKQGNFEFWAGIVAGDTSDLVWENDYHPYKDMPRVFNPESGWLSSSNEPPWYMTLPYPLKSADYPPYLAPSRPYPHRVFRPQRSQRMLTEREKLSFEDVLACKYDTRSELADRILDELIALARASDNPVAQQAADALAKWNHHYEPESEGAVLFAAWYERYWLETVPFGQSIFAEEWDDNAEPATLPRGLVNPDEAVRRLVETVARLEERGIAPDAKWGDIVRMRVGKYDIPTRGGPGTDNFRMLNLWPEFSQDNKLQIYHGDAFIFLVEFAEEQRASVLMTYGNATQPDSAHVGDQLLLYVKNELRPAWRTRPEIEANLKLHEVFD